MAIKHMRFGIINSDLLVSHSWKLFTEIGKGKSDFYLAHRNLSGEFKASFHNSGKNHISFSNKFVEESATWLIDNTNGRFLFKWENHNQIGNKLELVFKVIILGSACQYPKDSQKNNIVYIPLDNNLNLNAIEFIIILSDTQIEDGKWPKKKEMNSKLIGKFVLENNKHLYCVSREIQIPKIKMNDANVKYFEGRGENDIEDANLSGIIFCTDSEGNNLFIQSKFKYNNEKS